MIIQPNVKRSSSLPNFLKIHPKTPTVKMAKINPFRAVRPSKTNLQNFSSKSYKTYSQIELVANLKNNPNSFLSIINLKKNTNFALDIAKRYELVKQEMNLSLITGVISGVGKASFSFKPWHLDATKDSFSAETPLDVPFSTIVASF